MPDGATSPDIGESNTTPRVEPSVKPPEYRHGPKLSRGNAIRMGVIAGAAAVLAACGVDIGKTPNSSASPTPEGLGGTPTQTWTPTEAATATETQTPTEIPLFTEAEVKAASSFDPSTWPEWLRNIQLHPETATEQQWQDEYQFVLAVREKAGIPTTSENKDRNPQLQSLWNATDWEQAHPDEVRAGKKVAITPVEYRAMIKGSKNVGNLATTASAVQTYKSEFIGPILGQNIDAERRPFDVLSGKLAGFGTIGGQDILLIDVVDTTGSHVLFPVVIYVEKGPTLPKGSKCIVTNKSYSNRHGGDATYTLPEDIELGPLAESTTGKAIAWEDLYAALGEEVEISGGGYRGDLQDKTGIPAIHGFSPLGLEIANGFYVRAK